MIRILLKHTILEHCINVFFEKITHNFSKINDLPRFPTVECPVAGVMFFDDGLKRYVVFEEDDDYAGGEVGDVWVWSESRNTWYSSDVDFEEVIKSFQ